MDDKIWELATQLDKYNGSHGFDEIYDRIIRESEVGRKAAAFDWLEKHLFSSEPVRYWDSIQRRDRWRWMGKPYDTLLAAIEAAKEGR